MEGLRGAPELLLLVLLSLAGGSLSGPAIRTVTVPEGGSVTLECAVRKPVSFHEPVQWSVTPRGGVDHTVVVRLEDGLVLKGADDPQNRFSLLDDSSLLIWSVKPGDSGLYSCNRQPVADLQVTTGPAIRTVTVPEGGSVTLICAVSKPPSFHEPVLWTVTQRDGVGHTVVVRLEDGQVLKGSDDPQNRFSVLDDSSLQISSVKPGDAGLYRCNRQPVAELQVTTGQPKRTQNSSTVTPGSPNSTKDPTTVTPGSPNSTKDPTTVTPGSPNSTKGHSTVTPGSPNSTKGHSTVTPGSPNSTKGHSTVTPGSPNSTKGHSTVTPGSPNSTKGHSTVTPGSLDSTKDPNTVTPGSSDSTKDPNAESPSPAGGSTSHTVHTSLVACGLAGLVSAVIATEIRSRRRAASGTRTGETP
ncbi:uncharacterized protein [Lepisosteus oculatus]|uniref:uncharacterized protein isoform X2 n=1 Tax=Lepisosteus oculatus TaxID=7918 RepID=UPI0035F50F34